jgi:hypothetical protein
MAVIPPFRIEYIYTVQQKGKRSKGINLNKIWKFPKNKKRNREIYQKIWEMG